MPAPGDRCAVRMGAGQDRTPCAASNGGGSVDLWPHSSTTMKRRGRAGMHRMSFAGTRTTRKRSLVSLAGAAALMAGLIQFVAPPAGAVTQSLVSLTFDNNSISQYNLGYLQALQPHGVHATNLTTDPNATAQVCNDRTAILQHGLTPVGLAYPGGTNNATVQAIVKNCQYGNARTAGGVSPGGAVETLPPANWFATKAYAPSAVTFANLQTLVNGAASHGGGWAQIVIGKICSQTLDPNNYSTCSAGSGHIELADLNAFLDWMANAGQAGGAPAGAVLSTVGAAVASADTSTPTTTIACNGSACLDTPYTSVVSVTLSPTDTGSGVASTHYTTDGSDPTVQSPTYTGAFNVNNASSSTTVKFRSWDYTGHVEATN